MQDILQVIPARNIFMVMGYRQGGKRNKEVAKNQFKYVEEMSAFACPLLEVYFLKKRKIRTYHIWEKYKDIARKNKQTVTGKSCTKYAVQL